MIGKIATIKLLYALKGQVLRVVDNKGKVLYSDKYEGFATLTDTSQNMWIYKHIESIEPHLYNFKGKRTLCMEVTVI